MRIDKYLWCVRYFKTRSIATQACKKGSVKIDKTSVKPARDVYPGDVIVVRKDQVHYTLQVLDLPTSRLGAKLVDQYRKDITPKEAFSNKDCEWLPRHSRRYARFLCIALMPRPRLSRLRGSHTNSAEPFVERGQVFVLRANNGNVLKVCTKCMLNAVKMRHKCYAGKVFNKCALNVLKVMQKYCTYLLHPPRVSF